MSAPIEPPRLYPTLRCRDAEAMIRFLEHAFGFSEVVVYRAGDGMVQHAELAFGSSLLMLGQAREDACGRSVGDLAGRRTDALYVAVPNPDRLHDQAKAAGATITTDLHDTDYASRDFSCRDPEGNLWSFGTYWPKAQDVPDSPVP